MKNIIILEGTVRMTVKDFEKLKERLKELERNNKRLSKIIKYK